MEDLALYAPWAIMRLSTLFMLFGLMYIILAEPRYVEVHENYIEYGLP